MSLWKKTAAALGAVVVSAGLLAVTAPTASAVTISPFRVLHPYDENGALAQPASADDELQGPFRIINRASGKCLEVADWRLDDEAPIRQWDCHGGANQLWWFYDVHGSNQWAIANKNSGKCIDVPGSNAGNGVQLIQWTCHYEHNQRFMRWSAEGEGPVEYLTSFSPYTIEIGNFSDVIGAPAQLWRKNDGTNQRWYVGE